MPRSDDEMSNSIANALVVAQPLSLAQLEIAYRHFKILTDLLSMAGPRFSEAKAEAARLGNVALKRLREDRIRIERERAAHEHDDGLEELR